MGDGLVLSTWSFGRIANAAAWEVLSASGGGGDALDAAVAGTEAVELDESVNSVGVGGLPDRTGRISLDACVMESPSRCGAVAYVRRYAKVARLARDVMERTQHVMLAGDGAEAFAHSLGYEAADLEREGSQKRWQQWREEYPEAAADPSVDWRPRANIEEQTEAGDGDVAPPRTSFEPDENHDTVGVLTLDSAGKLAGACSTSGMAFKVAGRVGDSPIIGQGLYVHPAHGAAVVTGTGELAMGICAAHVAVEHMRSGGSASSAAAAVVRRIAEEFEMKPEYQLGVITLKPNGNWSSAALREGFTVAARSASGAQDRVAPETIVL